MSSLQAELLKNPSQAALWEQLHQHESGSPSPGGTISSDILSRRKALILEIISNIASARFVDIESSIADAVTRNTITISEHRLLTIALMLWQGRQDSALFLGQQLLAEQPYHSPLIKSYHSLIQSIAQGRSGSTELTKALREAFLEADSTSSDSRSADLEAIVTKPASMSVPWQERPGWNAIKQCTENDPESRFILEYYLSALDGVAEVPRPALASETPVVSIVIPVYNNWPLLFNCVKSIVEAKNSVPFEVIVADDCSTDETGDLIALNPWLRHAKMKTNGRFILNCNNAAREARGSYIYFLNNDTIVLDGWLDAIIKTFESRSSAGVIGSQVLFPSAAIQESGGIIWPDGEAWNYGRNIDNNNLFKANYSREVDYVSGCALAIKRDLWEAVGGFSQEFCPAYCEDSDLCFKVRKLGKQIWVQPKSKIIHFEGLSNSKDTSKGLKAYQKLNLEKLNQKWKIEILQRGVLGDKNVIHASNLRLRSHRTILIVDHYVPQPDKDAGSRTVFAFCKALIELEWNVVFLPENFTDHKPYTSDLEGLGVMVLYGEHAANHFRDILRDEISFVDCILYNRPHITKRFLDDLEAIFPQAKTLYYTHDLHGLREQLQKATATVKQGDPIVIDQSNLLTPD